MKTFDTSIFKKVVLPITASHKGQNGKLMIIGGSHLFHAASLWALTIASKIVDMVFYSSVPQNNRIVFEEKKQFGNGIIVPREQIELYMHEAECVLIGPGMTRTNNIVDKKRVLSLGEINKLEDEGEQTYYLTKYLLEKFPDKKWVIDAGALQMLELDWLEQLNGNVLLTPHIGEFERLLGKITNEILKKKLEKEPYEKQIEIFSKEYRCMVLVKGPKDTICTPSECVDVNGGNAGMTKGGTGDVLAGLIAALACKNDLFLSAQVGSYFNKKAGEALFKSVGFFFNASELVLEIPKTMKNLLLEDEALH